MWGYGRQVLGIVCCCLCIGPILMIVGIGLMIASSSDSRGASISSYNSVVDAWNNQYLPQFKSINFYVQSSNGKWIGLSVDSSPDKINDAAAESQLHSYVPWKLVTNISVVVPDQVFDSDQGYDEFYFQENTTALPGVYADTMVQNTMYPGDGSSNSLNCNDGGENDYDDCYSACTTMGGQWKVDIYGNGYCLVFQIISGFCMKVSKTSSGYWVSDDTYGGVGCYGSDFSVASYQSTNAYGTIHFGGNITIRHANDPFIYLGASTNFQYNFGATRRQNFEAGWIMIITGGLFMVPMIALVVCLSRRHRHHHHHHEHDRLYVSAPTTTTTIVYTTPQQTMPYGTTIASPSNYNTNYSATSTAPSPYPSYGGGGGGSGYPPPPPRY